MKCQVCHVEAAAGASFCQHCGAKLSAFESGPPTSASPAPAPASAAIEQPAAPTGGGQALAGRRRSGVDVPEETLWEGSYSPKAMLGSFAAGAVASVVLVVVAIMMRETSFWMLPLGVLVAMWLALLGRLSQKRLGVHYKLTNQMFYHTRGVMTRVTDRVEAIDIDDVLFVQGPFDRMTGVGKIKISSSDRTDPELWIDGIENVQAVAQMIDKARRAERIRRGVSVEAV